MQNETPPPAVAPIITGHFNEGPGYANWRTHGTHDYLLMLTLSGAGRIGYGGGELVTHPGDLALLRPGALHDYGTAPTATGWELLWAHFLPHPHWLPILTRWPEHAPGLAFLSLDNPDTDVYPRVRDALYEMHRRALGGLPHRDDFARCALEEALLWADTVVGNVGVDSPRDPRVARAAELLLERMAQPLDMAAIAATIGLSASRLGHLFRAQTSRTPQQFLEDARMARARQLLALTNRTVAAIAEEVGYENPFYFTLRFTRREGVGPREWRRAQGDTLPL